MRDKVIAITGASSGIGEAAARLLTQSGAKLVLGARRGDRLSTIATSIRDSGGTAIATELDVTERESMQSFVACALREFGRIDVLVNNAGIMKLAPLAETRVDDWNRMIDVNLRGVLNGVAAALPPMLAQNSGHIIMIGSTSGDRVAQMSGVYAATKFAVRAIAEGIRLEGGKAIRSTLISPGAVRTELLDNIDNPSMREALQARLQDALPVDAVARAIAYAIEQADDADVSEILIRPPGIKE